VKGSELSPRDFFKLRVEVLYEALLVKHKYGTHKVYLANEYVQYNAIQDIREIEFRDSGSNTSTKICLRFEPLLYIPAFTQKNFHYVHTGPPTKGTSTEEFAITNLEYTTPLSNTTTSTQEARHKAKTHSPPRKRDGQKAKPQSPLHKRWAQSQTTITSTQEGQGTKPNRNHDHLYTRGIRHKAKAKERLQLGDHNRPQTTLGDLNRPQIIFLTKQDPIDRIRDDSSSVRKHGV